MPTFSRLINNESLNSKTYTLPELFADLQKGVWGELETKTPIDLYRRNLQKIYVDRMTVYLTPASANATVKPSEVTAIVRAHLVMLRTKMRTALITANDSSTRNHLQDLVIKIDETLNVK
jgi:hypothetical protein